MNSVGIANLSPMNAASALQNDSAISAWQEVNLNTRDPILFVDEGLIPLRLEPHLSPVVLTQVKPQKACLKILLSLDISPLCYASPERLFNNYHGPFEQAGGD